MTALKSFLLLTALLVLTALPARADENTVIFRPVNAVYMVRDAANPTGYVEKVRWTITSSQEWAKFYNYLPDLPKDDFGGSDPLSGRTDDMIVFSHTDDNGLTGFDIYVNGFGIMAIKRGAVHAYYPDANRLWTFLRDEQKERASYEKFSPEAVSKSTRGIVVTYNISESIPNPIWVVNTMDELKIYNSFFKGLRPITGFALRDLEASRDFDSLGTFVMNLNYGGAPAKVATVSNKSIIRLSNGFVRTDFYQDTKDFYKYFKNQARDNIKSQERFKDVNKSNISKGVF